MADEIVGQEPVVSPVGDNPQQTPNPAPVAQAPVPANNGWEAEKKAFIADLQKERRARQEFERQSNTYKTQYETEQKRVRALSGVDPLNPAEVEAAEVRARFKQVVPREQLLEMLGLDEDDIQKAIEDDDFESIGEVSEDDKEKGDAFTDWAAEYCA